MTKGNLRANVRKFYIDDKAGWPKIKTNLVQQVYLVNLFGFDNIAHTEIRIKK
jgi:hypothetical protein